MLAAHGGHALHGVQIAGVALHQRGGQHTGLEQALRAIGVGHDVFEQAHALQHARLDLLPAQGVYHQRQQVERPGALGPVGVGVNVVRDAVVAHLARELRHAWVQAHQALGPEVLHKL